MRRLERDARRKLHVPATTAAWLIRVASRRLADLLRIEQARQRAPAAAERVERLRAVLHVLYLIFNEGDAQHLWREPVSNGPLVSGDPVMPGRAPDIAG